MPQEIVSQFDRKFNEPIETYRRVATPTSRDAIPSSVRWQGMLVYVTSEAQTYELKGGITNSNWTLFTGIPEAPQDGGFYARKNAGWQEITTLVQTSGQGTSGIVLKGDTSGTYTIGTQSWTWKRVGDLVAFKILLGSIDGATPTGTVLIDLSGTDFPEISTNHQFNAMLFNATSFNFYHLFGQSWSFTEISLRYRNSNVGGYNYADSLDFSGGGQIQINGTYIADN